MLKPLVGDACAHLPIGDEVVVPVLRCEEEENGAVITANGKIAGENLLPERFERLVLPVLDRCREDADVVCVLNFLEFRIEPHHLCIREDVDLVDDTGLSEPLHLRRCHRLLRQGEGKEAEAEEEQDENGAVS